MGGSYIVFTELPKPLGRKTRQWSVASTSGTPLGRIAFYPRWRCYTFHPDPATLYNAGCLTDIARFCDDQTARWRARLPE